MLKALLNLFKPKSKVKEVKLNDDVKAVVKVKPTVSAPKNNGRGRPKATKETKSTTKKK